MQMVNWPDLMLRLADHAIGGFVRNHSKSIVIARRPKWLKYRLSGARSLQYCQDGVVFAFFDLLRLRRRRARRCGFARTLRGGE